MSKLTNVITTPKQSQKRDDIFDFVPFVNPNVGGGPILQDIGQTGLDMINPVKALGFLGRSMDKAADPILGAIHEIGANKDPLAALQTVPKRFADEVDYTGKHAISGLTGGSIKPEEMKGLG
jgi:hypothetical protein